MTDAEVLCDIQNELRQLHDRVNRNDMPMTVKEASSYLQIHPDTLYRWAVEEGRIAYCRLGQGNRAPLRFLKKDLDDFLESQRIPTVEEVRMRRN